MNNRILIFPCSGIGKSLGSVTREAAYQVCLDLKPKNTKIGALSLLVMGDDDARAEASSSPSITIDGCTLACASKMVQECNGKLLEKVFVIDAVRKHRELKPQGIANLNEDGLELARVLAEDIENTVDHFINNEESNAGTSK